MHTYLILSKYCPNIQNCWSATAIYDFCIPVDFLDVKDLKKLKEDKKQLFTIFYENSIFYV